MDLTTKLVLKDGSIDREASRQAFDAALDKHIANRELEQATIAAAVNGVFDRYPGAGINMPALAHGALQTLNAQPGNYKTLEKRVLDYVRENAGTRESGALFSIGKGVKGGCRRWSDVPVEAPAAPAADAAPEAPAAS